MSGVEYGTYDLKWLLHAMAIEKQILSMSPCLFSMDLAAWTRCVSFYQPVDTCTAKFIFIRACSCSNSP